MNLAKKLLMTTGEATGGNIPSGGYVDDVFSTYLYTGNGSSQTINNGIDLAGKGGLLWTKSRNNSFGNSGQSSSTSNFLWDFTIGKYLNSDSNYTGNSIFDEFQPLSNGFLVNTSHSSWNASGGTQLQTSWTFRCAERFFDIVTYTGNGVAGRQIAHSLGAQAGFITVKSISTTGDWNSYHRSATGDLKLNTTDAQTASRTIIPAADASTFTVSGAANTSGVSYVAYLFAHDPAADGIIQCGSFTTNGSGNATVNLGWEPQYLTVKASSTTEDWIIVDSMRGIPVGSSDARLLANTAGAETSAATIDPSATGFSAVSLTASHTFVYIAIRRPNKPPTTGTQVYNASTASGVVNIGFPVDLHIRATRAGVASNHTMHTRLTGGNRELVTSSTAAEETITDLGFDSMTGLKASLPSGMVNHFFRRAPKFFDVVCDTGTGAAHTIAHNLTKAPELIIRKSRSAATQWEVWHSALLANERLVLNSIAAKSTDATAWNSTIPTSSTFTVGTNADTNAPGVSFVTYLFATLPGISKVGSYSGNGGTQTIPCGFTTGSRFILIKRIDNTGDWFVWDTARGITPTTDPHLSFNTTAAEVTTDDSIDQDASGFVVNQNAATNINALGGNYLFLAIA